VLYLTEEVSSGPTTHPLSPSNLLSTFPEELQSESEMGGEVILIPILIYFQSLILTDLFTS